jgi:hypothetical protein
LRFVVEWSHGVSCSLSRRVWPCVHAIRGLTGLDRNSTGSTRLDRQGLDNGLDSGSTEPRQLDSSTVRAQAASSSAQRQWRSLGARSMLDARSFMISTLRSQVGFAAAVAHARLRLSRLELIGGSGRTAGRYASAARAFISPTAFEQARGGALGAGGGRVGFAGGGLF